MALATLTSAVMAQPATDPVAGLAPDRRPTQAPKLVEAKPDAARKAQRLAGVSTPWPGQLERVAEQGEWYAPLFHPGMPGRYDLLGRHRPAAR